MGSTIGRFENAFEARLKELMFEQFYILPCLHAYSQPLPGIDDQRISVKAAHPIISLMEVILVVTTG